jgi:hypothetical protein
MKFKWFWMTLLGLSIFTVAVFSRALIFGTHSFNPQIIGSFDADLNGLKQKNEIWVNSGNINDLQKELTQAWEKEGWAQVAQGMDFAPTLLGLNGMKDVLSPYLQMKLFEKGKMYRSLNLLQGSQNDQTYGWVSETPKDILDPSKAISHWDFPLRPPVQAKRLYLEKYMDCQMAFIFVPANLNPKTLFSNLCTDQNFELVSLGQTNERASFMLMKGHLRILAMLDYGSKENLISMVYFNKN